MCVRDAHTTALTLVDEMDNQVWQTYGPAPNLAFLIGTDRRVVEARTWYPAWGRWRSPSESTSTHRPANQPKVQTSEYAFFVRDTNWGESCLALRRLPWNIDFALPIHSTYNGASLRVARTLRTGRTADETTSNRRANPLCLHLMAPGCLTSLR